MNRIECVATSLRSPLAQSYSVVCDIVDAHRDCESIPVDSDVVGSGRGPRVGAPRIRLDPLGAATGHSPDRFGDRRYCRVSVLVARCGRDFRMDGANQFSFWPRFDRFVWLI